jgi:UDPglucose 6-dehydrogenase
LPRVDKVRASRAAFNTNHATPRGFTQALLPLEALVQADALIIVTEWKAFQSPDFELVKARLKNPIIFDGRNLFEPAGIQALGIEYHGVGRGG